MSSYIIVFILLLLYSLLLTEATNIFSGNCIDISEKNLAHYEEINKNYVLLGRQEHTVRTNILLILNVAHLAWNIVLAHSFYIYLLVIKYLNK